MAESSGAEDFDDPNKDQADLLAIGGGGGSSPRIQKPPRKSLQRVPTESEDEMFHGAESIQQQPPDGSCATRTTLRQVAEQACKRIDIGTAIMPQPLFTADVEDSVSHSVLVRDDESRMPDSIGGGRASASMSTTKATTPYARQVVQEFNAVVIEHHLKWAPLCTDAPLSMERLGRYDFHVVDRMVDWCWSQGITKIKGHVLVWHVTSPVKILEQMDAAQVRQAVRRHIFTVMNHFRGRIAVWDVCNECLAPDGTLAENIFYRKLGPSYVEDCFRWAHEADPTATLLYNDNKVEGIGTPKADGLYHMLADLKAKHVPVHGCGLQAHFNAAGTGLNRPPTPYQLRQQIRRLGDLGLTVNISELDVRVSQLAPEIRDTAQRQIYHDLCAAALSEPAFDGIWLWGFTDRHTWVHAFYYDDEPCILDEEYQRKPAYEGLRQALQSLTPGHVVGGDGVLLDDNVDDDGLPWGDGWINTSTADDAADGVGVAGDARPDWEQTNVETGEVERSDLDSGDEADVDIASNDFDDNDDDDFDDDTNNDDDDAPHLVKGDAYLPPIS